MAGSVQLDVEGAVATITNDNPEKHNAFDDAMDAQLFDVLAQLRDQPDVRAIIWRGEGKSFSSGRDVGALGGADSGLTHHELMRRGHRGIRAIFELDAPDRRRPPGLGHRRVLPAGPPVRHQGGRRGRPLHVAGGRARRDP